MILHKLQHLESFDVAQQIPDSFSGVCTINQTDAMIWIKNGKFHRDNDLPAVISFDKNGQTQHYKWYQHHELHRLGGPAVETFMPKSFQYWYKGEYFVEEQFWKLPEMQKHKLNSLVKL